MTPLAPVWIGMALIVAWFTVEGIRQGVVRRIVELAGLVVVFLFASRLAGDLEPVLHENWGLSARVAFFTSWVVVLVGGVVAVRLLATLSQKIVRLTITGWLDRAGGALLGALFGAVLVSCALIVLLALPLGEDFKDDLRDDRVTGAMLHFAPDLYDAVSGVWDGESFFEMIREHVEPAARGAAESLRAVVEDLDHDAGVAQP